MESDPRQVPDTDWSHLYPEFRWRLEAVLGEFSARYGATWEIVEGYRDPARQLYLYRQGRSLPGWPVVGSRVAYWHSAGLAADIAPRIDGEIRRPVHLGPWKIAKRLGERHGLENPEWAKNPIGSGHLQLNDVAVRAKALAWIRAGRLEGRMGLGPGYRPSLVPVRMWGLLVEDAGSFRDLGDVWVWGRAVLEQAGWVFLGEHGERVQAGHPLRAADVYELLGRRLSGGRVYVPAGVFHDLGFRIACVTDGLLSITPPRIVHQP